MKKLNETPRMVQVHKNMQLDFRGFLMIASMMASQLLWPTPNCCLLFDIASRIQEVAPNWPTPNCRLALEAVLCRVHRLSNNIVHFVT